MDSPPARVPGRVPRHKLPVGPALAGAPGAQGVGAPLSGGTRPGGRAGGARGPGGGRPAAGGVGRPGSGGLTPRRRGVVPGPWGGGCPAAGVWAPGSGVSPCGPGGGRPAAGGCAPGDGGLGACRPGGPSLPGPPCHLPRGTVPRAQGTRLPTRLLTRLRFWCGTPIFPGTLANMCIVKSAGPQYAFCAGSGPSRGRRIYKKVKSNSL